MEFQLSQDLWPRCRIHIYAWLEIRPKRSGCSCIVILAREDSKGKAEGSGQYSLPPHPLHELRPRWLRASTILCHHSGLESARSSPRGMNTSSQDFLPQTEEALLTTCGPAASNRAVPAQSVAEFHSGGPTRWKKEVRAQTSGECKSRFSHGSVENPHNASVLAGTRQSTGDAQAADTGSSDRGTPMECPPAPADRSSLPSHM
jgi:hypothetical protein